MRWVRTSLVQGFIAAAVLSTIGSFADEPDVLIYYEPHTGFWDVVDLQNPGFYAMPKVPPNDVLTSKTRAGSITWNVTYQDVINNNSFGWDDPTFGAARRATFLAVLDYVSSVLNESPATPIDVHWNLSTNSPAGSTLASMGTFYFLTTEFSSGIAHQHITTGTDPSGMVVDISGQVNFGRVWNSETDDPTTNEFDLFSVLLHETTHGLGEASLLTSGGISSITMANPGTFSFIDRYMAKDDADPIGTGSATALFSAAMVKFVGSTADLVSQRLVYTGPQTVSVFGSNPQIYAPNPFENGSSLSHWDYTTGNAVMLPAIASGVKRRAYLPFEIANLVDLGYPNAASANDPANIYVDFSAGSNGVGTSGSPYDNLTDAVAAVSAAGTIHLQPGSSSETFTGGNVINQSVTLTNDNPGGGVVQIGVLP